MPQFIFVAAIAIGLLIAGLLLYASTKPDTLHVERSIHINASPENIYPLINDFHLWDAWTPYNKDPKMKKTYSGSEGGKGAHCAWDGNKQVGQGEVTLTDTTPPNLLVFDLHMIKPFEERNVASFNLTASGNATQVAWNAWCFRAKPNQRSGRATG